MFPLEAALLPGEELPLRIFEPRYRALLTDCLAADRRFGVVLIAAGREVGGGDRRCDVGVAVRIARHRKLGFGQHAVIGEAGERIRVLDWLPDDPYPRARVQSWPDEPGEPVADAELRAVTDRLLGVYRRLAAARGVRAPSAAVFGRLPEPAGERLYALAARAPIGPADRYAVLAAPSPAARLTALRDAVDGLADRVAFELSRTRDDE
ncbi:LON peptidase substrate-binding domain-containing protein [Mycobacterium sp. 1274756.6]|uniref:LON peptidase substrate-binding domain-containing protein n=1 Tax=Mycobacterium sp. 1274756.6 TaxID=1834076 RepID=UPI0008006D48|nr:LON peptidase substrate-binding domain-containing protein [Mycobacterium sp. 1274756.6]OBJ69188.1 ATP-dependent protease [Mycobacterium sp. 1274756.6]